MRRMTRWGVVLSGALLTGLTFGGFLGSWHWAFDLVAHPRLQYTAALLLLSGVGWWALARRRWLLLLLPALLANLLVLLPFWISPAGAAEGGGEPLRVVAVNVYTHNRTPEQVWEYLRAADADVVLLAEVDPQWMGWAEEELGDRYPFVEDAAQRGHFGMALLSRIPWEAVETHRLGARGYPSMEARLSWEGETITIYGAHPHPPLGGWGTALRDGELAEIVDILGAVEGPLLVLGDLNATPWSASMQRLFAATSLRHGAQGFGIAPTWWLGTPLLGFPYDHVLVSPEWGVTEYELGPANGSDHYPVLAEVRLR